MSTVDTRKFTVNLEHLVAFTQLHATLKVGLAKSGSLNPMQFCTLFHLCIAPERNASLAQLRKVLNIRPNAATQATNALVDLGYATRSTDPNDGRAKYLAATSRGARHLEQIERCLQSEFESVYPEVQPQFLQTIKAGMMAARNAGLRPVEGVKDLVYSHSLACIMYLHRMVDSELDAATKANLTECMVLMRLSRAAAPMRVGALADQLHFSPVTITRSTNHLCEQGYVERMHSSHDHKAVFAALTDEGRKQAEIADSALSELLSSMVWNGYAPEEWDGLSAAITQALAKRKDELLSAKAVADIG